MPEEMVRVQDPETKQILTIPSRELAPGMILVNMVGVGHLYVDPSTIKESGPRHAELSPHLADRKTTVCLKRLILRHRSEEAPWNRLQD